jgi:hypothetical protein
MERTTFCMACMALLVACLAQMSMAAQQPNVRIDGDNITLTGCVVRSAEAAALPQTLAWTRGEMMLAGVDAAAGAQRNPIGTSGISGRVFYWLDDDEDLAEYLGQRVEIKGELEDFEEGEIEVKRDGSFTEIELDIDGREEKARVPTSWFGAAAPDEAEFKIAAREVDVEDIRVIGSCGA